MFELPLADGITASFQRFPSPDNGLLARRPPSAGALPLCPAGDGGFVCALPDGEACWIGLTARPGAAMVLVGVLAELSDGSPIDVLSGARLSGAGTGAGTGGGLAAVQPVELLSVPPSAQVAGILRPGDGWLALCRESRTAAAGGNTGSPEALAVRLHLVVRPAPDQAREQRSTAVELVDGSRFRQECGERVPAPSPTVYGGWRLP
ncbi:MULTISPECIES: hypothetical protein [Crystallibacter]|uniref:hypothetical protein n=1 Tax=Crystallibacter TaxID=3456524 RepID=UPI00147654DF|nr:MULTISPECIES: hypothetical protein [unclassified Arthrobacter]MCW2131607.1 hypothetical protein [Arthrobacter sp. VKM Ac-2550]NMR30507.1 hypothetical protein [Arthrobacter sp. SF27]